jgi:hypothetical protein
LFFLFSWGAPSIITPPWITVFKGPNMNFCLFFFGVLPPREH